jgi:hypothetical protein
MANVELKLTVSPEVKATGLFYPKVFALSMISILKKRGLNFCTK